MSDLQSTILTKAAFEKCRNLLGVPRLPPQDLIANSDQKKLMVEADGLIHWVDGKAAAKGSPPLLEQSHKEGAHLWVVRVDSVVHVAEQCAFGQDLESEVVKHTNLTGGSAAHSGGELVFLEDGTIVVNGCSGRYGPRSKGELDHVVRAFVDSGYGVWCMGFDEEANKPLPFIGTYPEWVE